LREYAFNYSSFTQKYQIHHDAVTSIIKQNSLVFIIGKMLPSKLP